MKTLLSMLRTRAAWWLGLAALALSQAGCAHPVVMEPSVVVQGRLGGPVYGSVTYGPPPVVYSPAPVWLPPPPPVLMAPRVVVPSYPVYAPAYASGYARPAWRGGHHEPRGHGWGRRGW